MPSARRLAAEILIVALFPARAVPLRALGDVARAESRSPMLMAQGAGVMVSVNTF